MLLNKVEFFLMNSAIRAFVQEKYEMPILVKLSRNKNVQSALEIGCGCGNGTRLIKKYFNPEKIAAIDLDKRMIETAKKKIDDKSVEFMVMDAVNLEFPENSFDIIFDFGIIHHIPNWWDCIGELKRVLKNKGEILLEELSIESFKGFPGILWKSILTHPYKDMFTLNEFEECLKENGFTDINKKKSNPLGILKHISLAAILNKT